MRTRNRYEVVKAAGVKFKVRQYDPARDGKDPAAFVRSKNDRRRHYTVAQKRKLLGESIKANSGKSDRQHAAAAGAHHNTATQVRRELESTGEIAGSRESVGADGQVRVVPRQRLTRSRPQRDPLEAYKAQVCDLVLKYLYDPAALIDGLCKLDPKLAELVDAIDQARDEQVNGADDFEIAEPQGPAY